MTESTYDESLEICNEKTSEYDKTFCLGMLLGVHKNSSQVQSGEVCQSFNDSNLTYLTCIEKIAKITGNETICDSIIENKVENTIN
jgi:hypothetical protein